MAATVIAGRVRPVAVPAARRADRAMIAEPDANPVARGAMTARAAADRRRVETGVKAGRTRADRARGSATAGRVPSR